MNNQRRFTLTLLFGCLILLLVILLRSFIFENIILPIYALIIILYRVLLSIDQVIYWLLFSLSILLYVFYRWLQQPIQQKNIEMDRSNVIMQRLSYWQTCLHLTHDEIDQPNELRRDLIHMLVVIFSLKQNNQDYSEILKALKQGHITLPYHIHSFLFPDHPLDYRHTETVKINQISSIVGRWIKKITGQNVKDYYQSIEEVLIYMETLSEIK